MYPRDIVRVAGILLVLIAATACSPEGTDGSKPIAKVGEYVLTEDEFRKRIVATREIFGDKALTLEDKMRYLDREIDKEVMIQEASRLNLTQDPKFTEIVQRFWEQTLITRLFETQAASLAKQVIVTDAELRERYKAWCKQDPKCPPLDQVQEKIQAEIMQEKKAKALDQWLSDLRKRAKVTVYEDNLRSLR